MKKTRLLVSSLALVLVLLLSFAGFTPQVRAADTDNFCNLVVFVKFADDTSDIFNAGSNTADILKMYNNTGTTPDYSFKNYIRTISEGQLLVHNYMPQLRADGGAVATLALPGSKADYTDSVMIDRIAAAVNSGTIAADFAANKPDFRDAGWLDNLTVLVQGSSSDARSDLIYPHRAYYDGTATMTAGGVTVGIGNYNVIDSDTLVPADGTSYGYRNKQGTLAHEFLHSVGLPDLYRYSGDGDPVGIWSIMAASSPFLQYPLSYSRAALGWIPLNEITHSGTYTLNSVMSASGSRVFKISTPMSASEFFVLEYRKKVTGNLANIGFETKIPSSGLLAYRVNDAVAERSNAQGNNYIYVFRPGATSANGADETDANGASLVLGAAIDPAAGETSYGSADFSAPVSANTLFYSDGSNSGIVLSNIAYAQDGESISFDVTLPDYSALGLWDDVGAQPVGADGSDPAIAADGAGRIYAAFADNSGADYVVKVRGFDGTAWTSVGADISGAYSPRLACFGGAVYLLCAKQVGTDSAAVLYKLTAGAWVQQWQGGNNFTGSLDFVSDGTELYAAYVANGTTLVLRNARTGAAVNSGLMAGYLTNPAVACFGGAFYAVYSDFNASPANAVVAKLDTASGSWSEVRRFALTGSNSHAAAAADGKLYVYAANANSGNPVFAVFDGSAWTEETISSLTKCSSVRLSAAGGVPCLTYADGVSGAAKALYKAASGSWTQLGGNILSPAENADACLSGGTVYAAAISANGGKVYVKSKALTAQAPAQDDYTVTVTPPDGYTDTSLWIDGREYAGTSANGALSAAAADGNAKTVSMYRYSERGIPEGMYVWTLAFANGAYTATPRPALQDLLSYHGFSVRVTGNSGIRCKTGISAALRAGLTSAGVDGFTLAEYGTVVMNDANRGTYPLVRGGAKTTYGRAYWTSGGTVNDAIFETTGGRIRFTSVLVGIPVANYKTEFAFRGYIILNSGGTQYTFYGPVVHRSIYYVSQQVLDSGQFAAGTAADTFLRRIISDADAYTANGGN